MTTQFINFVCKTFPVIALSLVITACGGGTGTEDDSGSNKPLPPSSSETASSNPATSSASIASSSSTPSSITSSSSSSSLVVNSRQAYSRASVDQNSSDDAMEGDLPPTPPSRPEITLISFKSIGLQWGAAGDDTGVTSYEILRNGVHVGTTTAYTMSFEDQGLTPDSSYSYTIRAVDINGHRSQPTAPMLTKTLADTTSTSRSSKSTSNSSRSSSANSNTTSASAISSSTKSTTSTASYSSTGASVQLTWAIPSLREDGSYLELDEIGGYELRHKPRGSSAFTSRLITDAATHNFILTSASKDDTFEIAAYDRNGLYSRFVRLTPL